MSEYDKYIGGYRIDLEDRGLLLATQVEATYSNYSDIPERVDPRNHPLAREAWLQVEDQGQIGSCQGQALTENLEYCFTLATGKVVQFSRMFAYLMSQIFDGINGDRGSTLSGGTKTLKQAGICTEKLAPYTRSYPGHGYITDAMKQEAVKYKLLSHTEMRSAEQIRAFIGSGIGIVQIGIAWGNAMEPDSSGCIKSFSAGGGGHSVSFCGYIPDSDINIRSSAGYWILLKNSWGTRWGRNGYAYVDPRAVDQMLKHQFTVMYGRSDLETPEPRPIPHDFTKKGNSFYA